MTWRNVLLALALGASLAGGLAYAVGRPASRLAAKMDIPEAVVSWTPEPGMPARELLDAQQDARLKRVRAEALRESARWAARQRER